MCNVTGMYRGMCINVKCMYTGVPGHISLK